MQRFDHPSIVDGQISFEDQVFDVVDGVVTCPAKIGHGADWPISMKPAKDEPVRQLVTASDVVKAEGTVERIDGRPLDVTGTDQETGEILGEQVEPEPEPEPNEPGTAMSKGKKGRR